MLSNKSKIVFFVLFFLFIVIKSSFAQGPEIYGELRYSELQMPESFDPITSESGVAMRLTSMLFDPLIGVGPNNEPRPILARSFTNSSDNKSIIIEMRDGATWHDGTPITAEDVEFTINMIKNPASNVNKFIKKNVMMISDVTVLDPLHIIINLMNPVDEPAFILSFPILPKHMGERMGPMGSIQRNSSFSMDPSGGGSGKFMFSSAMYTGPVTISRNPNYYDSSPSIENGRLSIQPLYENIASSLLFGAIHLAIELPPKYLSIFASAGNHYLRDYNSLSFQYIGHNFENPTLRLKDVRRAITLATDRVTLLKIIFLNRGQILSGPYTPSDPGFNINVSQLPYDPESAKEILDDCGFSMIDGDGIRYNSKKNRLSFNLKVIADRETTNEVALQFQAYMREIGIDINIEQHSSQRWLEIARSGDFDMILGEKEYNAFAEIPTIFSSDEIGLNGLNYTKYRNDKVDSLLEEMFISTTAEGRKLIKWKLHEIINEEQPYLFLWSLNKSAVFQNCVRRVKIHPFEFFTYINEWWIDESEEMNQ